MVRSLRVAVVGFGTAGQATAIFLGRQGHRISVFEDVLPGDLGPVGAGVGLQPVGLAVLARTSQATFDTVLQHGARIKGIFGTTHPEDSRWPERPVLDLAYADFDRRLYGLGVHRGALWEALRREVESVRDAGGRIELHGGVRVAEVACA